MTKAICILSVAIAMCSITVLWAQAQRPTIPEAIAAGSVGSVATAPSGPPPTVDALLQATDIIVVGTIGEPVSYLSSDQRDVYTDYPILNSIVLFDAAPSRQTTDQSARAIVVTQVGGTVTVNGAQFTHTETALAPLQSGRRALFLLHRDLDKYFIAGKYYGVFDVTSAAFKPLMSRQDFATEYPLDGRRLR